MVGVTALISGYLLNQFWPDTFSGGFNSPLFMILFCVAFAFGVAYIAYRGVTGTTGVNMVINIVQITALLVFSVMAISYRARHPEGSQGLHLVNGTPIDYVVAQEPVVEDGKPKMDPTGAPVPQNKIDANGDAVAEMKDGKPVPFVLSYAGDQATTMEPVDADHPKDLTQHFQFHAAGSVSRRTGSRSSSSRRASPSSSWSASSPSPRWAKRRGTRSGTSPARCSSRSVFRASSAT